MPFIWLKLNEYALQLARENVPVISLLDIHYVCLHIIFTSADNLYLVMIFAPRK